MRRIGTQPAQTRRHAAAMVAVEGGGIIPTLDSGGGARARVPEEALRVREGVRP
jgi:hypothetical protein